METFGDRIAQALEFARKDRADLAAHLSVSDQAIGQVINGRTKAMNAYNAARTARFLGVSFYWLCTGQGRIVEPSVMPVRDWPFRRIQPDDLRALRDADKLGEVESFVMGCCPASTVTAQKAAPARPAQVFCLSLYREKRTT